MNRDLRDLASDYLALRRAMSFQPCDQEWLIARFLDYLDDQHAATISVHQAVAWACSPRQATPRWWSQRLGVIRSFAAHVHAIDPRAAELIPAGLLHARVQRAVPYLYTPTQIAALISQARKLRPEVRGQTLATIIGLMAATGLRTSEAVALDTTSVDTDRGTILVLGKGGKKRLLPVHATTMTALAVYVTTSRRLVRAPQDGSLFVSLTASRPLANSVQQAFRAVATDSHLQAAPGNRAPRLHDLRHTFAVNTLLDAHRSGVGVQARIAALATYLGHGSPANTYWYLTASPELLQLVNDRIENHVQAGLR